MAALCFGGLGGCTLPADFGPEGGPSPEPVEAVEPAPPTPAVDWAQAPDCREKLELLQQGLSSGRVESLETTPFTLVSDVRGAGRLRTASAGWAGFRGPGAIAVETASEQEAARCVIRLGPVSEHAAEHRVLGQERVRSSYQSGSHREKNPAYDAAQARLRQAERASKPSKSSIISVGDPLIDLVGTLIGGAITGVGQWREGDPVELAIEELMATPRSIEQPVYRSYQFERARIRASRQAVIPVILTDRVTQTSWRVALKRREVREIAVLDGLDRQDRDYARHRENGMTDQEFRQWQAEPPELALEDMVAGLIGAPVAASIDRVASADRLDDEAGFKEDQVLDAALLPPASQAGFERDQAPTSRRGSAGESLVNVVGKERRGQAVYVTPSLVLAASDLVEGQGLVDVEDRRGGSVLGLVTTVDRSRGLALIQVPRPGLPALLAAGRSSARDGEAPRRSPAGIRDRSLDQDEDEASGPLMAGNTLIGFQGRHGPALSLAEIRTFLSEQDVPMAAPR